MDYSAGGFVTGPDLSDAGAGLVVDSRAVDVRPAAQIARDDHLVGRGDFGYDACRDFEKTPSDFAEDVEGYRRLPISLYEEHWNSGPCPHCHQSRTPFVEHPIPKRTICLGCGAELPQPYAATRPGHRQQPHCPG